MKKKEFREKYHNNSKEENEIKLIIKHNIGTDKKPSEVIGVAQVEQPKRRRRRKKND